MRMAADKRAARTGGAVCQKILHSECTGVNSEGIGVNSECTGVNSG